MPKMPTYNSQRSLTTDMPAPIKEGSAQEATAMSPLVDAASQIHQKWNEAVDTMQYTSAKASFETGMMDIMNRASQDPDYNGSDKYFKEIETLKRNTTKGISNKQLEQRVGAEFGVSAYQTKLKIDNIFKKKMLENARGVTIPTAVNALINKKVNAMSAEEFAKADMDLKMLVENNVLNNTLSRDEGDKILFDAEETAATYEVYQNPMQGKADIKAGNYKLNPETKTKLIIKADELIKKQEGLIQWQAKQVNTEGAFTLAQEVQNGTLDVAKINYLYKSGNIDSETASAFYAALENDYAPPETTDISKPEFFLQLLEKSLDNKTEALEIIKAATESYGSKTMGRNQYAYFISEAGALFNERGKGQGLLTWENIPVSAGVTLGQIKQSWQAIESFVKTLGLNNRDKAKMGMDFVNKIQEGKDSTTAQNEVILKKQQENPDRNLYEIGQVVSNPRTGQSGKVIGFYPDGTPDIEVLE